MQDTTTRPMDEHEDMVLFDSQQLTYDLLLHTLLLEQSPAPPVSHLYQSEDTLEETGTPLASIVPQYRRAQFACPVPQCRRVYVRKGDLGYHIRTNHTPHEHDAVRHLLPRQQSTKTNKIFCCPVQTCQCGYMHRRDLQRHVKTKHENRYG